MDHLQQLSTRDFQLNAGTIYFLNRSLRREPRELEGRMQFVRNAFSTLTDICLCSASVLYIAMPLTSNHTELEEGINILFECAGLAVVTQIFLYIFNIRNREEA